MRGFSSDAQARRCGTVGGIRAGLGLRVLEIRAVPAIGIARESRLSLLAEIVAERVGVLKLALRNPNEDGPFSRNAFGVSDLASSDPFARFRLFTPVFGFCQPNVTRNVTRGGSFR